MSEPAVGLFVPLPAQEGKKDDLKNFLLKGRELINGEPLTLQWYAVEYTGEAYASTPTFAIFDTFAAMEGLTAHKEGEHTIWNLRVSRGSIINPILVRRRRGCAGPERLISPLGRPEHSGRRNSCQLGMLEFDEACHGIHRLARR